MNKKNYYLLGGIIVLVILIIVLVSMKGRQNNSLTTTNQNEETTSGATDNSLTPNTNNTELVPEAASATPVSKVAPVYTKEIKIEFMTTEEKTKIGIPADSKVQVLGRDKDGTILAYKVINSDADILNKYGN